MGAETPLRPGSTIESRGVTYRLDVLGGNEMAPLLPLLHDAFPGRVFTQDWLKKKYACESGGLRGFACVAYDESGTAAGSVGVLPWPVRYVERVETAGQMVDVATASAHRGRGLFVLCAEMARQVCEDAGVGFLFGFPNEPAYPIWINKLGYEHIHDLVEYRSPIVTVWAEGLAAKVAPLSGPYERYVENALARRAPHDGVLQNSLLAEGFAGVNRDAAFHQYKTTFTGCRVVEVGNGRVWIGVGHGLAVGDFDGLTGASLLAEVAALRSLARRLGLHQVTFQASKDTRFDRYFASLFRTTPGMPVIYRGLSSEIPSERLRFSFGDLDNF